MLVTGDRAALSVWLHSSQASRSYLRLPRILGGGFSTRKELDGLPALWTFLAAAGFSLEAAVFFVVVRLRIVVQLVRVVRRFETRRVVCVSILVEGRVGGDDFCGGGFVFDVVLFSTHCL